MELFDDLLIVIFSTGKIDVDQLSNIIFNVPFLCPVSDIVNEYLRFICG